MNKKLAKIINVMSATSLDSYSYYLSNRSLRTKRLTVLCSSFILSHCQSLGSFAIISPVHLGSRWLLVPYGFSQPPVTSLHGPSVVSSVTPPHPHPTRRRPPEGTEGPVSRPKAGPPGDERRLITVGTR